MYKLVAAISVIIRTFYLPNPFECLEGKIFLPCGIVDIPIPSSAVNLLFGVLVLAPISFEITGLYYEKGYDSPVKGSFLYLVFFSIHVGLLHLIAQFGFVTWAIALILAVYAFCHIAINTLKARLGFTARV